MSIQVNITKGFYRGKPVSGTFALVKAYQDGAKGGFVTIRNPNPDPGTPPVQRVQVEKGDFTMLKADGEVLHENVVVESDGAGVVIEANGNYEREFIALETEDEAMERIAATFGMLDKIVDACAKGNIRGLVVTGPPGIGKSYGVEKQLDTANMFRTIAGQDPNYEMLTGAISPIGLYQKLYHNRKKERVLCLDDCDSVLFEEECLMLMKGALNSGDKRRICWNKESRILEADNIPEAFDFEGSIIFLSNVDFERTIARGSRIAAHLEAIMSRCHYMDLEISTVRDQILRIKQVMRDGMLMPYDFKATQEAEIFDFVKDNSEHLREVSLRMVKKIADFVKTDPKTWMALAEATCLQREAKFKRLLSRKKEEAKRGVELKAV